MACNPIFQSAEDWRDKHSRRKRKPVNPVLLEKFTALLSAPGVYFRRHKKSQWIAVYPNGDVVFLGEHVTDALVLSWVSRGDWKQMEGA